MVTYLQHNIVTLDRSSYEMFGDQDISGGYDLYVSDELNTSALTAGTAGRISDIEMARGQEQGSRRTTRSSLRTSISSVDGHELREEGGEMMLEAAKVIPGSALKPMRGFQEEDEIPAFDEQQVQQISGCFTSVCNLC